MITQAYFEEIQDNIGKELRKVNQKNFPQSLQR
jgi:hypothetical protein